MSIQSLTDGEIKARFSDVQASITESARAAVLHADDPVTTVDVLVDRYGDQRLITGSDVETVVEALDFGSNDAERVPTRGEEDRDDEANLDEEDFPPLADGIERVSADDEVLHEELTNTEEAFAAIREFTDETPPRDTSHREFTIGNNITGDSTCTGSLNDLVSYFSSRYEKLSGILAEKQINARPIESLGDKSARQSQEDDITIVGMVNEIRDTQKGNRLIELEDPTGLMRIVYSDKKQIEEIDERLVTDIIVAAEGKLSDDGGIIFGNELYFPDIPPQRVKRTSDRPVKAALISDIHFGAKEFAHDKWNSFVEWIRDEPDIEYLLVAGDLVEGIGIYAGQKDELVVPSLTDQYRLCAHAFRQLPSDIDIIVIPGNHDGVRLAEPQPELDEDLQELFNDNVHFGGNPARVTIENVVFLLYHGVSLNPLIDALSDADIQRPTTAMWPMLLYRHLAPIYGTSSLRLAPEHNDLLAIDVVPDVFHTGHIHTFGLDTYKSVIMANTGAWQHQSQYQRDLDIDPDVGYCVVVNLQELDYEVQKF
jgi:DNA polymerase II small subunit